MQKKLNDDQIDLIISEILVDLSLHEPFEFWRDRRISSLSITEPYKILKEYYKDQKKLGFIPGELTFRLWYNHKYEQDK